MGTQTPSPSSRSWLITLIIIAVVLTIFNVDPVGDAIVKKFGEGADTWFINIFLGIFILYFFWKKK